MHIDVVILAIFLAPAVFTMYALFRSWRRVPAGTRFLAVLFAMTFLSQANSFVASELPVALKGGGPAQGKIENGHYFVGNHGRYTEVSPRFFYDTLRYEHISFWVATVILTATVVGFWLRFRRSSKTVQSENQDTSN